MKSLFRSDEGGPAFYGYSNRTSVTGDINMIGCCLVFFTFYIAFLIIFPGIRKQKFTTFVTVTLSLFIGNVIFITKLGSSWHAGKTHIQTTYCAMSKELINADLGVHIGLAHVNITLKASSQDNSSQVEDINYNERFYWKGANEMNDNYREALIRGLPYPILTVAEYFSLGQEGFCWGGEYRAAGYYGSILLWAAFASWLVMNILLVVVPRYGAYAMIITSTFMLLTCYIYYCLLPTTPLIIRFEENQKLTFSFGWCFWLTFFAGIISAMVGIIVAGIDLTYPHSFSNVLEVDYDTPYDRHVIIEVSHYHKKKKSNNDADASAGIGRKILRHLSTKIDGQSSNENGVDNHVFEMDPQNCWQVLNPEPVSKNLTLNRNRLKSSTSTTFLSAVVPFVNYNKHSGMDFHGPRKLAIGSIGGQPRRNVAMW